MQSRMHLHGLHVNTQACSHAITLLTDALADAPTRVLTKEQLGALTMQQSAFQVRCRQVGQ